MLHELHVHFLPELVDPARLRETVVVIDVLRATTTIVHAMAAGAAGVIPCGDVEVARRLAEEQPGEVLLGGERGGLRIPGFDLGNSPAEYKSSSVGGKNIVFTTTNGTKALEHCRAARRVWIGSFVNLSAVREGLESVEGGAHLLCSGVNGRIAREDVLLAGALVDRLSLPGSRCGNDEASIARDCWRQIPQPDGLASALRDTAGGRNLIDTGQQSDIDLAAQVDRFPTLLPKLEADVVRM